MDVQRLIRRNADLREIRMEHTLFDQLSRRRPGLVGRRQFEHRPLGEHVGGVDLGIEGRSELAVAW